MGFRWLSESSVFCQALVFFMVSRSSLILAVLLVVAAVISFVEMLLIFFNSSCSTTQCLLLTKILHGSFNSVAYPWALLLTYLLASYNLGLVYSSFYTPSYSKVNRGVIVCEIPSRTSLEIAHMVEISSKLLLCPVLCLSCLGLNLFFGLWALKRVIPRIFILVGLDVARNGLKS